MKLVVGQRSDPGPREGQNQDTIATFFSESDPVSALLVVADGMGGANAGEMASQEAVRVIQNHLTANGFPSAGQASETLHEAIRLANESVHQKSQSSPEMEGMGCTVVAVLVIDDVYWVASVGDSRAYLVREGDVRQLTDDHTWVNARVRDGLLTPEQAENHSLKHVLERALGTEASTDIDVWPDDLLEEGDTIVICTDGLYGVTDPFTIRNLVENKSAQEASDALITHALNAPTHDNVSVIVMKVE
jgi:protein phosphatase